jgi:beta-galactosidase
METTLFNGGWLFQIKGQSEWKPVELPHDWLIWDVKNLYKSDVGYYKKTFDAHVQPGQRIFIRFDGVYMDSTLYVNGIKAGEWKYGYTAFEFNITDFCRVSGENELLLEVNYRSPNSRWYSGAGIYRDCFLIIKNSAHFISDGIYITPKKENNGNWRVEIDAEVETGNKDYTIKHNIINLAADTSADGCLIVKDPQIWDITNPVCYTLCSELIINGEITDTVYTRFGFREIGFTTDKGFFLNGRRVKIQGACQHHDLGALGAAVHKDVLKRQLLKLREMGVNAIRTAHNPPASVFMELADEMGFLVMNEFTDIWKRNKTTYDYACHFEAWSERDVASWIRRDRNSPSVIMWSIGNEVYDTHADPEDGKKTLDYLAGLVKKHDPKTHAPVTLCSNYMPWEQTQRCVMDLKLVGYNYSEYLYDEHHAKFPDWYIYGGETASTVQSRGVYHFPFAKYILTDDDLQCSSLGNSTTSWGAKNTQAFIDDDKNADFSLGQFIWTGTDYIGEPTPYSTKNSYFGQIDTAGFPKDAFYVIQAGWTDYKTDPMVHIFPYWDFSTGQPIDIRVCSNAPKVELFFNGKPTDERIIPYAPGELKAIAYDENNNIVAESTRRSFGDAVQLVLHSYRVGEILFVEISAVDAARNPVENANNRVNVTVNGGEILGMDNGDSTDYEEYKTHSRRLFSGKLLVIIRPFEGQTAQVSAEFDETDIPIRKIELTVNGFEITAKTFPENATHHTLEWRLANDAGIESPLGTLTVSDDGKKAILNPKGDGEIFVRCAAPNGKGHPDIISVYPVTITGYGTPFLNPYDFISGGLYNRSNKPLLNGNERGIATFQNEPSHVGFADLDFGAYGSDELSLWLFPMSDEPFPVEIWNGMPGEGTLLCTATYDKGSVWAVYQKMVCTLPNRLTGVQTLCFVYNQKVHMKGFKFVLKEKAYQRLNFKENDQLYGDSFTITETAVENIGNNVSVAFTDMDFTKEAGGIEICWRSELDKNTVRVVFADENGKEIINIIQLLSQHEYAAAVLPLDNFLLGRGTVTFIFLPGCDIDIKWFMFHMV